MYTAQASYKFHLSSALFQQRTTRLACFASVWAPAELTLTCEGEVFVHDGDGEALRKLFRHQWVREAEALLSDKVLADTM